MTTRTDIHRPTELVPENYRFVQVFDNSPPRPPPEMGSATVAFEVVAAWEEARDRVEALVSSSPLSERGLFQCHHCGAHLRFSAVMEHLPTGNHILVGETCLGNRFSRSAAEFHALRRTASLDAEAQRARERANEWLSSLEPDSQLRLAMTRDTDLETLFHGNEFAVNVTSDIRNRLWRQGRTLSERQVALVLRLLEEAPARAAQIAARETEARGTAPSGRVQFTGEVVSRRWQENQFGGTMRLLVRVDGPDGVWRVWVSEPAALSPSRSSDGHELVRGDVVTMTATVTPSRDDESFGFGSRPSGASRVQSALAV